jgi:signal transduction histidine kinase
LVNLSIVELIDTEKGKIGGFNMTDEILHKLQERVKELTAIHKTARIIQNQSRFIQDVLDEVVMLLPPAWQFPEITAASIVYKDYQASTENFVETEWIQIATLDTSENDLGMIRVCYLEPRPVIDEGPFLKEERDLIESLAEMLRSYFMQQSANTALQEAYDKLEEIVAARTGELSRANNALQQQIADHRIAEKRIESYQRQLRQLTSELSLAEARERRDIASDLHDHIGQGLAFIKMSISQLRGNAIFCGFENVLDEIMGLLDSTIQYTRNLTFEISPPVLYELGLESALEWLAERFSKKHGLKLKIQKDGNINGLREDLQITLFKSTQEILTNAVKHSGADKIVIKTSGIENKIRIEISDNGRGFDTAILNNENPNNDKFGLFNIKERLDYLGGQVKIKSAPNEGTQVMLSAPRLAKEKGK